MKLARSTMKRARIEIIPMIDTMFFLLVFFMLASLAMIEQHVLPVNLPHAATGQEEIKQVVMLTLTQDGNLFCDKDQIGGPAEVTSRLSQLRNDGRQLSVVINADRGVEHGRVIEVLDAVRQSGVAAVAIAVRPSPNS
ncbi:MAG: biopolymer transporter ExbD [Negativicutes bacterium]|nr:biopolymer transporter ExbD [Negativicutes bacterium]MDR3591203.1 biopolymer transporter ExbD [Negativicutes bacterium]